jgi:TRAP-type C4-dicarboxylate transport system permease small subunit
MVHGLDAVETAEKARVTQADGLAARALAAVNRLVVAVSSVALIAASVVLTYSVIVRYFLHFATDWQDEVSVFLIIGAVFLSSAAVQARRGHIGIEAIVGMMSERANRIRQVLVDVASFAFCGFFAWKAWLLLDEAITEGYHSGSTWGPPLWIPYSLMTVGMALLSLQILLQVVAGLSRKGSA